MGTALGVTFWPAPPLIGRPRRARRRRSRRIHRLPAALQHRILVEVDRQILAVVAVGDRALQVAEDAAQDRAAREELRPGCSTVTPPPGIRTRPQMVAVEPSVISVPPSLHELRQFLQAFHAHAAADVVGSSRARRGSASARSSCRAAARCRSSAMPLTWTADVPPTCGKMITSYFARRLPSRSFWSAK